MVMNGACVVFVFLFFFFTTVYLVTNLERIYQVQLLLYFI